MTTLRKDLTRDMKKANEAIKIYDWVESHYPDLLDLEVYTLYAYDFGSIELIGKPGESNGLAAKVASILGVKESFEKEFSNGYEKTCHEIPSEGYGFIADTMRIKTKVSTKDGCKTYRVLHEYETTVCGDPPSGNGILEVEELA